MLLAIYLNDHLAGSTVGLELARRAASSNRTSSYGTFLHDLAEQINEDRQSLKQIMRSLDVRTDHVKVLGAWSAEKLGRLKLNGRLRGYSPLSRVVELEGLALGVRGKLALWHTLEHVQREPAWVTGVSLTVLIERAERQLEGLEEHRLQAVAEAFE